MQSKTIESYGGVLFTSHLKPVKKRKPVNKAIIVGFDTEYTSRGKRLLSMQFSFNGHRLFIPYTEIRWERLEDSWGWLIHQLKTWLSSTCGIKVGHGSVSTFVLPSFWSIAEAQFFDVLGIKCRIDEWGMGNYDWSYPVAQKRIKGRIVTVQTIRILDLQTWFRGRSLAQVAQDFGLRKLDTVDRTNVTESDLNDPGFIEYAIHDAYLCEEILNRLRATYMDSYGVDILSTRTPAATAVTIYKRHYLKREIEAPSPRVRRQVLKSSWGGNNQCFIRGQVIEPEGIFEYDAISMYPSSAVALGELPYGRFEEAGGCWRSAGRDLEEFVQADAIGGVCRVKFEFPPDTMYPCLPQMHRGSIYYTLRGVSDCTLAEVRLALEMGAEVTLLQGYYYTHGDPTFPHFLGDMLRLKEAATDGSRRAMYKLNANASIGKMLQHVRKTDINAIKELAHIYKIPVHDVVKVANLSAMGEELVKTRTWRKNLLEPKVSLGCGYYPEWNCLILGYARAVLAEAFWRFRAYLGTTDSLITKHPMPRTEVAWGERVHFIKGVPFALKRVGNYLSAVRTRLYLFGILRGDGRIELCHIAHHGIRRREEAERILLDPQYDEHMEYDGVELLKLRESLRIRRCPICTSVEVTRGNECACRTCGYGGPEEDFRACLGDAIYRRRLVNMSFDEKRVLVAGGISSRPLDRIAEG